MELSLENHMKHTYPCPVCQKEDSQPSGINTTFGQPFNVAFCPHCGLYFFSEIPSKDFLKQYYSKDYFTPLESSRNAYFLKSFFARFRALSQFIFIENNSDTQPGKIILETGSADGSFLSLFKKKGWEVKGLEYNDFMREKALKKYNITLDGKDIMELNPENETYNVIALPHVLEHMPDPVSVLKQAKKLLRKDGFIFIELPFSPLPGETSKSDLDFYLETTHLFNFRDSSLEKLINLAGLEIVKMERYFYPVPFYYKKYRNITGKALMTGKLPGINPFKIDALTQTILSMLIRYTFKSDPLIQVSIDSHWHGLGDNIRVIAR